MKRTQQKRQSEIADTEHRGEELGRRRAEDLREAHSAEQSDRSAQPTAGERSILNSREESKEQKEQCQLQAETCEENHVSKREFGPMTRNKDTESRQRMAADQELKVAEKAQENTKLRLKRRLKLRSRKQPS